MSTKPVFLEGTVFTCVLLVHSDVREAVIYDIIEHEEKESLHGQEPVHCVEHNDINHDDHVNVIPTPSDSVLSSMSADLEDLSLN